MKKNSKNSPDFSFAGFVFKNIKKEEFLRNIIIIVAISLFTKILIGPITSGIFHSFVDLFDINYYFNYSLSIFQGQLPYLDFSVDYPQIALLYFTLPMLFAILTNTGANFIIAHQIIMTLLDVATSIIVYLIVLNIFDNKKAFIAGIIYATSFSSAYFVLTKYDSLPVFLLMLSVFLFINQKNICSYLTSSIGFFTKWFAGFTIPFFLIYDIDKKTPNLLRNLIPSIIFVILITLPLLILNFNGYLNTITGHMSRVSLAHSLPFLLDNIAYHIFNQDFFSPISTYLSFALILLFIIAYNFLKEKNHTNLIFFIFSTVFVFVFFNKVFSPQYAMWIVPFLALFLINSYKEIILFYLFQIVMYLEFPLLFNQIYIDYLNPYYLSETESLLNISLVFFGFKFILLALIYIMIYKTLKEKELIKFEFYNNFKKD